MDYPICQSSHYIFRFLMRFSFKLWQDLAYFLLLYVQWRDRQTDLKFPSSHLLETGMCLDSQGEPNDSISSPFEPIVEKRIGCLC